MKYRFCPLHSYWYSRKTIPLRDLWHEEQGIPIKFKDREISYSLKGNGKLTARAHGGGVAVEYEMGRYSCFKMDVRALRIDVGTDLVANDNQARREGSEEDVIDIAYCLLTGENIDTEITSALKTAQGFSRFKWKNQLLVRKNGDDALHAAIRSILGVDTMYSHTKKINTRVWEKCPGQTSGRASYSQRRQHCLV